MRSLSTDHHGESSRSTRSVASTITPSRPMPPRVARNSSGSVSGVISRHPSAGVQMRSATTWRARLPSLRVALAVHVARDRAAHRHVPCTGHDREHQIVRGKLGQELCVADTGLHPHEPLRGGDRDDPIEGRQVEHGAAGVLCRVAIAAARPARDHATGPGALGSEHRSDLVGVANLDDPGAAGGDAAPPGKGALASRSRRRVIGRRCLGWHGDRRVLSVRHRSRRGTEPSTRDSTGATPSRGGSALPAPRRRRDAAGRRSG